MSADPFDGTAGRSTKDRLEAASEDIDRAMTVLPERIRAMVTAMNGWPAGRGFDTVGGRSSVSFCEEHERERCDCGRGTTYAAASDPTGDAALPADQAKADHDRVVALSKSLRKQAAELVSVLGRYSARQATPSERQATLARGERSTSAFECWSCARTQDNHGNPWFQPAARRVSLADGETRLLCEWCRSWLREVGELPSVRQVDDHRRGRRVARPEKSA